MKDKRQLPMQSGFSSNYYVEQPGMPFPPFAGGQQQPSTTGFVVAGTGQPGGQGYPGGGYPGSGYNQVERRLDRLEDQVRRLQRQVDRLDNRVSRIERQISGPYY